jgi:hypothetical protein
MGNGKKATNPTPKEQKFNQCVIVLAYESDEGDMPDEFVKMAHDLKDLFSMRPGMRMYAVVEESANRVLAQLEDPL